MKHTLLTSACIITLFFVTSLNAGCRQSADQAPVTSREQGIFPHGELGPADHFTGNAWNTPLVANDSVYNTLVGSVYFEPGARSNWHSHPSGQILLVTDGVGYYQEKGQARQTMRKGDVIKCAANVLHWHGASPDTGLHQLYILPKTENGFVTWLQPVTDKEYNEN